MFRAKNVAKKHSGLLCAAYQVTRDFPECKICLKQSGQASSCNWFCCHVRLPMLKNCHETFERYSPVHAQAVVLAQKKKITSQADLSSNITAILMQ